MEDVEGTLKINLEEVEKGMEYPQVLQGISIPGQIILTH